MPHQPSRRTVAPTARKPTPAKPRGWASPCALCLLSTILAAAAWAGEQARTQTAGGAEEFSATPTPASEELIGIVFAHRALNLETEIEGQVGAIVVELGQHVNRDQVLLRLDSPWLSHDLEVARASVASSQAALDKATLERDLAVEKQARRLQAPDAWSAEERAEIQLSANMAKVQVALASAQLAGDEAKADQLTAKLERATVRAPFAGAVSARYCELGERLDAGAPLVRLISDADLQVRFGIPESMVSRVAVGSDVEAHFPILGLTVPLKISRLAPEIDLSTGLATAEGTLTVPEAMRSRIWPGMTVRVRAGKLRPGSVPEALE